MKKSLNFLCVVLILAASCWANTYYVDFSTGSDSNSGTSKTSPWRHAPGMVGCVGTCASTVLVDGDSVVFRGGVTWTGVFPWSLQGGSSSMITYTTDHTWYNGASWSQPTLDDQHLATSSGFLQLNGVHYVTINDLSFLNWGTADTSNSGGALFFYNTHDISFTNNTVATESMMGINWYFDVGSTTYSNFTVTGNDFSHVSSAIWLSSHSPSTIVNNFLYDNNTAHDFASQMVGGVHGDGFLHYFAKSSGSTDDMNSWMTNFEFCNNYSYGDFTSPDGSSGMTALLYLEGAATNALICNNVLTFSPGQETLPVSGNYQIFGAAIEIQGLGNTHATGARILNNLIWGDQTQANGYYGIRNDNYAGSLVENNIVNFGGTCATGANTGIPTGMTEDYNEWNCAGFTQWVTPGSHDLGASSAYSSNPLLASPPPPPLTNVYLTASSPAKGAGENLTSLGITTLNSDYSGVGRPASGAWDMGPFQSAGYPAPPTGLTVTVF